MKFPKMKMPKTQPVQTQGPDDNTSTLFLFVIGLLLSIFILVGNFGPIGFLPFGMLVAGFILTKKFKIKTNIVSTSGFNTQTIAFIAGGLILVLVINYIFSSAFSIAFLQPPISQQAILTSQQYANLPVYIYTSLFAISETYLFQGVILYLIRLYVPNDFVAVGGSSILWMTFHLFVYGSTPFVLAFIFFTGLVFGFITIQSHNILAATTIHGVNNLIAAGLTIVRVSLALIGVRI